MVSVEGQLAPNMAKRREPVTLKALAEALGLSQGTVSMSLSPDAESSGVALKTRQRVLKAAAEMNYRPNYHARSLSSGRSYTIGVIVPAISEGYYSTLIAGIEEYLQAADYFFFVTSHRWKEDLIERLPDMLARRGAEGLIIINTIIDHGLSLPTVRIGGSKPQQNSTNVSLDEERGTRLALEHLVKQGHRRIAFFRGERESTATAERWAGIKKAAKDLGIKVDPQLTVQLTLRDSQPSAQAGGVGYQAAKELLGRKVDFTALLAYNDSTAIGAIRCFEDAKLRVPQDVSVVGYDDIPAAEYERPALTTVHQPLQKIGSMAAKVLLNAIGGEALPPKILIEPELAVRMSTMSLRIRNTRPSL